MTSPDLINELRATRPAAPTALRARVREIAAEEKDPKRSFWPSLQFRRITAVAAPTVAALAIVLAGIVGLAKSDGVGGENAPTPVLVATRLIPAGTPGTLVASQTMYAPTTLPRKEVDVGAIADPQYLSGRAVAADIFPGQQFTSTDFAADSESAVASALTGRLPTTPPPQPSTVPSDNRAQRISATLTVEVEDSKGVSTAAQEALDLTKALGGYVVSSSVTTGNEGNATLTVRIPVAKVQQAIVQLSGLGRIVSQQVQTDDLQGSLDALERRERSVRAQIALVVARLDSESLDAATRARLEARLQTLRSELRDLRRGISTTNAEARMATVQMTVATPGMFGAAPTSSRLDRTLDEALNVLVWESVIGLALLIVAAPFALAAVAVWLGRRLYRRREEERLLAT